MCMTLNLPDGRHIAGIDELDQAIGRLAPIQDGYGHETWPDRRTCLCPVDFPALGKLMNWTFENRNADSMRLTAAEAGEKR